MTAAAADLLAELALRRLTLVVAESLTGGLLAAEFVAVPGASRVLLGGVVAYNTDLKRTLLGVDAALLESNGPVDPDVAAQMALGVRDRLAVKGVPADIAISTTGVAGPGSQDGHAAGHTYIAVAFGSGVRVTELTLAGNRDQIRRAAVAEALDLLALCMEDGSQQPPSSGGSQGE